MNGKRIGDDVLAPGWTDYHKRVVYQVYDVTKMVQPKANAIGAILGGGWYADALGWKRLFFDFGPPPVRLIAQLEIEYTDGTRDSFGTDTPKNNRFHPSASAYHPPPRIAPIALAFG